MSFVDLIKIPRRRRPSLQVSEPEKIMNLIKNMTDPSCTQLQIKINIYLQEECKSDKIFQIIINTERMEAYIDAVSEKALPRKYKIELSPKLMQTYKSDSVQSEVVANFQEELQELVGKSSTQVDNSKRRVDLIPVNDTPFSVIYCVVTASIDVDRVVLFVKECTLFTWPTLSKSIALDYEIRLRQKCQQLLKVVRTLFCQVPTLEIVFEKAKEQAKLLMKAEHCCIMLVDIDKMELYDMCLQLKDETTERRFPFNMGVTGEVIRTGVAINVRSPKNHPLFTPAIDCLPGINCRNFLCFPIRERSGIIGIGQLMNKIDEPYFDSMDEEVAAVFSVYCGICISHSVIYQKIHEAHIRNSLANELVMYHTKVTDKEVSKVSGCTLSHDDISLLNHLQFKIQTLTPAELPCYVLLMFQKLGYEAKFKMNHTKLCRFIVSVSKEYRPVPYHNWMHAVSVAQWAYAALVNFNLVSQGFLSDLQALMYLLAGLMHDLDHNGSSANYQLGGRTTLVALYSSEGSVMEHHRLSQAMCILNTEGCDILESLPRNDYDMALMLLRDFILATDLSLFFKNLQYFISISRKYQKTKSSHKWALQCLLMIAADLNDYVKDWTVVKKTAAAVLKELFSKQAEDVKKGPSILPRFILDHHKRNIIPNLMIEFMDDICIPLFSILENILPESKNCVKVIESHMARWETTKMVFAEVPVTGGLDLLLSRNFDVLLEQKVREMERRRNEELARIEAEEETDNDN